MTRIGEAHNEREALTIMEDRKQKEGRKFFWRGQRKKILKKSNGRCAHCSRALSIKEVSPDHAIPLSKGGTNDLKNIVPLCYDCNQKKKNYVIDPSEWFPYLSQESLAEIQEYYNWYLKEYNYITFKNFTKDDVFKPKWGSRQERRAHKVNPIVNLIVKLDKRDKGEIQEFFSKYSKRIVNREVTIEEDSILGLLNENGVYAIKQGGSIAALVAIRIGSPDVGLVCPVFFVYTLYKKYTKDLVELIGTVLQNLYTKDWKAPNIEYSNAIMICNEDPSKADLESFLLSINSRDRLPPYYAERYNKHVNMYVTRAVLNVDKDEFLNASEVTNCFVRDYAEELEKDCVPEIKSYKKLSGDSRISVWGMLAIRWRLFKESFKICLSLDKLKKKRFSFANSIVYDIYNDNYWQDEVINYRIKVYRVCLLMGFVVVWFSIAVYFIGKLAFHY